jgi:sugar/nucleoside kinase (ribokinase family)
LNEDEARLWADTPNLHLAARKLLQSGCKVALIKKGENGAIAYVRTPGDSESRVFIWPAFPLEEVVDPTGAGDAFAGGVLGALARAGSFRLESLRHAVAVGTVMASFDVEAFGPARLKELTLDDVEKRLHLMRQMVSFDET